MQPLVVAIFGPTASGKSAVAEALAERRPAEIVSADSMQAYRGLPILTNQPERPTRLVGVWPLDHEGSVGEYGALAREAIDGILDAGRTPIVVGGTGLYLRAALAELELPPPPRPGARRRWEDFYDESGPARAHSELAVRDARAAAAVHPNDRRRVVRALELHEEGSSLRPERDRLWTGETRHPTVLFGLELAAETLSGRIAVRTRAMFARGVREEVASAVAGPMSSTARKVIGLEEIATLPRGEAVAAVEQRTHAYAAYQRKWLRRLPGVLPLDAERAPADNAAEILATLGAHASGKASGGAQ
jgi:tRNA dimethylallyltransferase